MSGLSFSVTETYPGRYQLHLTISHSGIFDKSARVPCRTTLWSSARRMRIVFTTQLLSPFKI